MTEDKRKLAGKRLDQLALPPEQREAFAKMAAPEQREAFAQMAARDQAMAPALKSGKPQGAAAGKPQADTAGKPKQAIIAEALRGFDTTAMTIAAAHDRVVTWVVEQNKAKRTGEKIATPSRTSVARYLGRRKD